MSRWREVKQGKTKRLEAAKENTDSQNTHICAPITVRLKAFLTDTFMITMPVLYIIVYLVMGSREGFKEHLAQGWLYIVFIHMTIVVSLWRFKAQTPGMKAYDLYLVDSGCGKKSPGWIKCFLRYVSMQAAILSVIGMLLPLFMQRKEGLQDIVSRTCIVHKS